MRKLRTHTLLAVLLLLPAAPAWAQVGYGSAVAVGDAEIFVGEPGNTVPSGLVYVYRSDSGEWTEVARLAASDATEADGFGRAVVVDGDLLVVGAPGVDREAVFVFTRQDGEWTETAKLIATGGVLGDGFGSAAAMAGDLLAVGAPGAGDNEGAVYLFRHTDGTWSQVAELTGVRPDPAAADREAMDDDGAGAETEERAERTPERFGSSLALMGGRVLVGAPRADQRAGAVYVFEEGEDGWQEAGRQIGDEGDGFGSAILVAGDEVFVGASDANSSAGAVRVYAIDAESGDWSQTGSLAAFDGAPRTGFGSSLAMSDADLFVGAPGADRYVGRVYRFARNTDGTFTSSSKMGVEVGARSRFGASLAVRGDTVVAGIPGADYGAGSAVVMRRAFDGWDRVRIESGVHGLEPMTGARVDCRDGKIGRFPCKGVELYAFLPVGMMGGGRGVRTNDIWGWTDPQTDKEYALVGMTDQTAFVDVTDPYHPIWVGSLPMTHGAPGSIWRDIKVYADHAFVVSDAAGQHGVQIFDLTHLREYAGTPITFAEDAHYDKIHSAHNIVIDEDSAFAYVVGASGGGETCGGGLHMINIEDPENPVFAGCFADTRTGRRGTGYSHDAQCIVYNGPDTRYDGHEICFGSNETALSVADVTDKRNPVAVGMATYPNVAYTHQSWVSDDQAYLYMNDEGDEVAGTVDGTRTLVWDIRDLSDPILVTEYIHDDQAVDHNLYVVGDTLYESNYDSGLRILDISDRENPELVGYFDSVPWGPDGQGMGGGSWSNYPFFRDGHVVFTSGREGIFIVRRADAGTDPDE